MRQKPTMATALGVVLAVILVALIFAAAAGAATSCGKKVVNDWSDNSRIDRVYPLPCYQEGIEAIPADIRDYTNAAEIISRAFQDRTGRRLAIREREQGGSPEGRADPPLVDASSSSLPIPLLVLGGMSLALLGAGTLGYISRRRQSVDEPVDDA